MNNNGPVTIELAELNHQMQDERKEMTVGVTGEGQGLSEEDEYQINKDAEDVDVGQSEVVQEEAHAPDVFQRLQQQPQEPVVRWERFLPLRSLKVLLVENDDSTRQVVSALLRNCGYEGKFFQFLHPGKIMTLKLKLQYNINLLPETSRLSYANMLSWPIEVFVFKKYLLLIFGDDKS